MNVLRPSRKPSRVKPTRDAAPLPPDPASRSAASSPFDDESLGLPVRSPTITNVNLRERRKQRRAQRIADLAATSPAAVPRDTVRQVFISWRWLSAIIVVVLLVVLYIFLSQDAFYIHSIYVGYSGTTQYLTPPEIFERSGLANVHLFWVDAGDVERKLEQDPQVASAEVNVSWPPNLVQITISERQPALVWEQSGQRVWVDVRGRVMALRRDIPSLVRVIVQKPSKDVHLGKCSLQGTDSVLGAGSCIDQDTVNGVLQFKAMYPNVTEVVYDPIKGLGFQQGGGWLLWFGNGVDIPTKMAVYNAIVENLLASGLQPVEVNVANPDAPYRSAIKK